MKGCVGCCKAKDGSWEGTLSVKQQEMHKKAF